ncbi:MAG: NADAR family protein [Pseudomonadota bacterium]
MSGLFPPADGDVIYVSRYDPDDLLSSCSAHTILLDEQVWPTAEHYFLGMQFTSPDVQARIRQADSAEIAARIATPSLLDRLSGQFRRARRSDWEKLRTIYMTRALYTKCRSHSAVAARLMDTGTRRIVENSLYDYYWGCGRDHRGENVYGKILMDIREKLTELEKTPPTH